MTHNSGVGVRRIALLVTTGLLVVGAAAACGGSALSPETVAAANRPAGGVVVDENGSPTGEVLTPTGIDNPGDAPVDTPDAPVTDGGGQTPVPGAEGPGQAPAPATGDGVKAASCAGFKNSTGITDSAIKVASTVDVSGPVPGIFKPAGDATRAYAAYFNSTSRICGRKLDVEVIDTQTNTSGDAVATQKACDTTFASVGSIASFDTGGASIVKKCGMPEIRSIILNKSRAECSTCFSAQAPAGGFYQSTIPDYFTKINKAATQKAAFLYVNVAASVDAAKGTVRAQERRGWKFSYVSSFDIAEFNYGPYIQRMKSAGVRIVQMAGSTDMALRIARSMEQANFKPDYYLLIGTQYDPNYASGGSAAEGSLVAIDFAPIEDAARVPELALYMKWLQQVVPGAKPTYFGLYAWSAARLFVERAAALGGRLNRQTLTAELRKVSGWTANGLHAPQDVGKKQVSRCFRFLQVRKGKFVPFGPTKYLCGGRTPNS